MNARQRIALFSLGLLLGLSATAGDRVKVSGEFTYYTTASESPAGARLKAIEGARIDAMSRAFGTVVSEQTMFVYSDKNTSAMNLGMCDINGEWLGDRSEPEVSHEVIGRDYVYTARVEGWGRELSHERIDVDGRILCNGTDKERNQLRMSTFTSGDEMAYYFTSPVSGWLAIYLGDDVERIMQCLLPYGGQDFGAYPIEANREYVFFSKELAPASDVEYAAGLIVEARDATDFNTLYVIFSPNEFSGTARSDNKTREHTTYVGTEEVNLMPRETNYNNFQKWLVRQRTRDPRMQVAKSLFAIKRSDFGD